jgi:hypothetical protein
MVVRFSAQQAGLCINHHTHPVKIKYLGNCCEEKLHIYFNQKKRNKLVIQNRFKYYIPNIIEIINNKIVFHLKHGQIIDQKHMKEILN